MDKTEEKNKYAKDFKKLQKHWGKEIEASNKKAKKFHKDGSKIVDRFLGKTDVLTEQNDTRLNLFHSNTKTLMSMLYGQIPTIDVSRRYADSEDDVGRVAAAMLDRLINSDVQENGAETSVVLRSVLEDRLLAGLGCARVRYDYTSTKDENGMETTTAEYCPLEYYYWKDVLYGWGRSFITLPWIAYRTYLSKKEMTERFGKAAAKDQNINYTNQDVVKDGGDASTTPDQQNPTKKAMIWEIWDKDTKRVIWMNPKMDEVLDVQDDPLQLKGFFPSPPFFLANPTTTDYVATADFKLSQDLYNEIDILQTRIDKITEAVKVVGVYDQSADGVQKMMKTNTDNQLIPIERWAMFAEKGGLGNQIEWMPIEEIANTLSKLIEVRDDNIGLLQQVSGMADVMRGSLNNQYEGVGQTSDKVKFGSSRVQALQDAFAQFATDLMQLKADVMLKHYDDKTLVRMSNMQNTADKELITQALQLLRSPDAGWRVTIRPESVAMVDFAQLQSERTSFLNGMATFLQASTPMMEKEPATAPFLLQMLQWGMAGFKGSSEIEGVMDRAIQATTDAAAKKAAEPKEPSPEEIKLKGEIEKIQTKAQADMAIRDADLRADNETIQMQHQADMEKIKMESQADLIEIQAKTEGAIRQEIMQSQANVEQNMNNVQAEMSKQLQAMQISMETMINKAQLDIQVDQAKAGIEVEKERAKPSVGKE